MLYIYLSMEKMGKLEIYCVRTFLQVDGNMKNILIL